MAMLKPLIPATKVKSSFPIKLDVVLGRQAVAASTKTGVPPAPTQTGLGLDSSAVRAKMVKYLEKQGIQDERVLTAMNRVQRHRFVDTALANQAYEDTSLPIGFGQTISKPNVVARMIELLFQDKVAPFGRVLEIGTGCGYQAAVLHQLASEVYSIERLRGLHERAKRNVQPFAFKNLHLLFGDGMLGFAKGAPYTAIISAAGGEAIPQAWIDQLDVGGRLVAPIEQISQSKDGAVNTAKQQALVVINKTSTGIQRKILELVQFVPLKSGVG